jgi:hypothetical protein
MKCVLTILLLGSISYSGAQPLTAGKKLKHRKKISYAKRTWEIPNGIYLSLNPLAITEPKVAAILGLGVSYRFNNRYELQNEISILKDPIYRGNNTKMQGFRNIFTFKYTYGNNFYVAIENRIKQYTFTSTNNFYNATTKDTLIGFTHKAKHTIFGFALVFGKRINLSANNKWQMETSIGLGGRQRTIDRKGIPNGFVYNKIFYPKDGISFDRYYETNSFTLYVPAAIRFFYKL